MGFPYKAVVFDWAFTLVDLGNEDDVQPFSRLYENLKEKGFSSLPDSEEMYKACREVFYEMINLSRHTHREACFERVLEFILLRYKLNISGIVTLNELLEVYYKEMYKERVVYPDVVPVLEKLKSLGVRLGIVSNTTNPSFMKDYERKLMQLDSYFEISIYSSEVPFRKPHPSIFEMAISRLKLAPKDILFVGDDLKSDIRGAQGVGIPALWINRTGKRNDGIAVPEYEAAIMTDILQIQSVNV